MEKYQLKEDEVVLYKGAITTQQGDTELILTNLNIVFAGKAETEVYPTADVKIYQGTPQVKSKGTNVEIYLKSGEKEFSFKSKLEPMKFLSAIKKLLTGKSGYERGLNSVKNMIDITKENIGEEITAVAGVVSGKLGVVGKLGAIGASLLTKKNKNDKK